ncbi:mitochondrial carrier [Gonapodya prolifera JEL478]|uniref:Mitochondrial carrier n=1 Tax=Gonapodya prolifera (strain JEL478) TaxID=1344416 RepID=A0A139AS27_GONPJ|nr:mitochondrial carrier [Gonapodya prolifera JEL478]|eukprot:KXS19561.1 mitochondrial carrier [Gonapodya prolifera JEL478]
MSPPSRSGESEEHYPLKLNAHIAAGGFSGTLADSTMHALDTVKTRFQGQTHLEKPKYFSMGHTFETIVKEEGIRGLSSGLTAAALGSFGTTSLYFGVYELTKRVWVDNWGWNPSLGYFVAGGLGDFVSSIVYVPSEVLKTRFQLQGRYSNPHSISQFNYQNYPDAIRSIYRNAGFSGLYRGYWATIARDIPFSALQFTVYENLQQVFTGLFAVRDSKWQFVQDAVTGMLAGGTAGFLTTPLDYVKTLQQTQRRRPSKQLPSVPISSTTKVPPGTATPSLPSTNAPTSPPSVTSNTLTSVTSPPNPTALPPTASPPVPVHASTSAPPIRGKGALRPAPLYVSGIISGLQSIYRRQGLRGLWTGASPRTLWTSMQSMFLFLFYEQTLLAMRAAGLGRADDW